MYDRGVEVYRKQIYEPYCLIRALLRRSSSRIRLFTGESTASSTDVETVLSVVKILFQFTSESMVTTRRPRRRAYEANIRIVKSID